METTIYWKRNYHRWIKKKYFTCSQIVLIIKSLREIKDYNEIASKKPKKKIEKVIIRRWCGKYVET